MKKTFITLVAAMFAATLATAQVNVQKTSGTNAITGNLVIGTGKTLTATGTGSIVATAVSGATTTTDNAIARFDGTAGALQNSVVTLADTTGAMTWAALQDASFTAGSSGASLVLGQGANGDITINSVGDGTIKLRAKSGSLGGGGIGPAITEDQTTNPVGLNGYLRVGRGQIIVGRNATNDGDHIVIGTNITRSDDTHFGDGDYYTDIVGYDLHINPRVDPIVFNQNAVASHTFITADAVVNTLVTQAGNVLIGGATNISGVGGLKVFGTTDCSGANTGAFQTLGGGYFDKAVGIGTNLSLLGATSTITLGSTNTGSIAVDANGKLTVTPTSGTNFTVASGTGGNTFSGTGASSFAGSLQVDGALYSYLPASNTVLTGSGFLSSGGYNGLRTAASDLSFNVDVYNGGTPLNAIKVLQSGVVFLPQTTASTSIITGAFINAGGFGNAGDAYIGGIINSAGTGTHTFGTTNTVTITAGVLTATSTLQGTDVIPTNSAITSGTGTGLTVNTANVVRQSVYKVTTTYAAFSAAGLTADKTIGTLPAKTKLVSVYADCTATFTGGSVSDADFTLGTSAGGGEVLATFDVFTATSQRGLADADLGTGMTRAAAIQGGLLPSWSATTDITARLTTVGANTDQLTTGSITWYLVTEKLP